jgi:hypothetical protein
MVLSSISDSAPSCARAAGEVAEMVGGQRDVGGARAGCPGVDLAVDRREHVEVLTVDRSDPLAADEIGVLDPVGDLGACCAGCGVDHAVFLWMDGCSETV